MAERLPEVVATMRALGTPCPDHPGRPMVYLEYAAGLPADLFAALGEQLADVERASLCIDIGHVTMQHARGVRLSSSSDVHWSNLSFTDPRLPEVADQVEAATRSALRVLLELIGRVCAIGKAVHFHLHDGLATVSRAWRTTSASSPISWSRSRSRERTRCLRCSARTAWLQCSIRPYEAVHPGERHSHWKSIKLTVACPWAQRWKSSATGVI